MGYDVPAERSIAPDIAEDNERNAEFVELFNLLNDEQKTMIIYAIKGLLSEKWYMPVEMELNEKRVQANKSVLIPNSYCLSQIIVYSLTAPLSNKVAAGSVNTL